MDKGTWIVAAVLAAGMAQAANRTWVGNTDANFATLDNWNPASTIVANTPVFGAAGSAGTTLFNNLAAASVINGFTFTADAAAYTLNGNAIKLGGAINAAGSTVDQVFNFNIDINQGASGSTRSITASTNGATTTFNGAFTGTGGLGVASGGAIVLAGNNSFNGKVTLNSGTKLIIEHSNALGTPGAASGNDFTTVANNASLQFRNNITVGEDIRITGAGNNVGALRNLSGTTTLTGPVTLTGAASIYSASGLMVFDKTDGVAIDGGTYNIDLRGASDIAVNGVIAGTGSYVAKSDAGTLSLLGLNTFDSQMRVYRGTVIANTLADAGTASSLGTGASNSVIWIGNSNSAGTLRYTGAAAGTDRQIQIGGTGGTGTGGGIIESSGTGAIDFTAADLIAQQSGIAVARTLTLGGDNTGDNTISGTIADNDKASGGIINVTKADAGKWVLSGDNTYSGLTSIDGGTLHISHANALGSLDAGTTVGNNGILEMSGDISLNEALTVVGTVKNTAGNNSIESDISASGGVIRSDAGTLTINGNIDAAATALDLRGFSDLVVNGVVSGSGVYVAHGDTGTLSLLGQNTFTSQMRVDRGVVIADTIADAGVASSLGQGTDIRFGWQNNEGGTLRYIGGTASTDRQILLGTPTVNATHTASGKIENNGTGALAFTAAAFNAPQTAVIAARTLTLGGSNADANSILGLIADNNTAGGGTIGLVKANAGTWVLSGDNTYSGATIINGGLLVIDGDQSAATGAVTVNANGVLGGSGVIGGTVTVLADGTLSAGNSPGTLTFNDSLTLSAGSFNIMEITDTSHDILMGDGANTLTMAGETIFDFTGYAGGVGDGYTLALGDLFANWDSVDLSGATYSAQGLGAGQSLDVAGGNLTVIPEPATLGLVVALGCGTLLVRRIFKG